MKLWISIVINFNFHRQLVPLTFILRNLMFAFSKIISQLIKQLYNMNLRKLPIQHGEVSVMR